MLVPIYINKSLHYDLRILTYTRPLLQKLSLLHDLNYLVLKFTLAKKFSPALEDFSVDDLQLQSGPLDSRKYLVGIENTSINCPSRSKKCFQMTILI